MLGGIVVVGMIVLAVTRSTGGASGTPQAEAPPPMSTTQASPKLSPSASATPTSTTQPTTTTQPTSTYQAQTAIMVKNNAEFKALLKVGDYCAKSVERFAEKYAGRTVSFDAHIAAMDNHGSYKTQVRPQVRVDLAQSRPHRGSPPGNRPSRSAV